MLTHGQEAAQPWLCPAASLVQQPWPWWPPRLQRTSGSQRLRVQLMTEPLQLLPLAASRVL